MKRQKLIVLFLILILSEGSFAESCSNTINRVLTSTKLIKVTAVIEAAKMQLVRVIEAWGDGSKLSDAICTGASREFKKILREKGLKVNIANAVFHTYLVIPNFFRKNSHLIIDPTFRQFFSPEHYNKIPVIFIGSRGKLYELMQKYYKYLTPEILEDMNLLDPQKSFLDHYLDALKKYQVLNKG